MTRSYKHEREWLNYQRPSPSRPLIAIHLWGMEAKDPSSFSFGVGFFNCDPIANLSINPSSESANALLSDLPASLF
jgi:hypothetical protein